MKPNLILGLGNPLMGDDGVGWKVAELLTQDSRLPPDTEAHGAGSDLLRWTGQMEGRRRVILIDAILRDGVTGSVECFEDRFQELETRQWNAHHLSAPHAISLLQMAIPSFRDIRFTLLGVTIQSVEAHSGLSPALNARLPEILDLVVRTLDDS